MGVVSCACMACLCANSTRAATGRCAACSAGNHPGLPRRQSPGLPIAQHERMYSQACSVCGAPPGKRCFKYQDRTDAKGQEIESGTYPHSEDLRGVATPSRSAQGKVKGSDASANRSK